MNEHDQESEPKSDAEQAGEAFARSLPRNSNSPVRLSGKQLREAFFAFVHERSQDKLLETFTTVGLAEAAVDFTAMALATNMLLEMQRIFLGTYEKSEEYTGL